MVVCVDICNLVSVSILMEFPKGIYFVIIILLVSTDLYDK